MAYRGQSSFAAGEIDPALRKRTSLEKFKSGLATALNIFIGKTGRLISRQGTRFYRAGKIEDKRGFLFSPPYTDYVTEWGDLFVRIHNLVTNTYVEVMTPYTEDDLEFIQLTASGKFIYIWCKGQLFKRMVLGDLDPFEPDLANRLVDQPYEIPPGVSSFDVTITPSGTPAGYDVEYLVSFVDTGQETIASYGIPLQGKLPVAASQYNTILAEIVRDPLLISRVTEMRVYRRPENGSAHGFIGATSTFVETTVGPNKVREFKFQDFGQEADYAHTSALSQSDWAEDTFSALGSRSSRPATGTVYQQRLVHSGTKDEEAVFASRPKYHQNFTRDFPLSSSSALAFKAGSDGTAQVLRLADIGGLAAFTTRGLYVTPPGALTPDTAYFDNKGNWVIDPIVEPLKIPGSLLFSDKSTKSVRALNYSNELSSYDGIEISIWSAHFFRNKRVVSWAFQDGEIPVVWVVLDSGEALSLTYQNEQEMRAWTRHVTDGKFESVTIHKNLTGQYTPYFYVNRNGKRNIEFLTERYVEKLRDYVGMDAAVSVNGDIALEINSPFSLTGTVFSALDVDGWDGEITLSAMTPDGSLSSAFTDNPGEGEVGTIFQMFGDDGRVVTLEVTEYVNNSHVVVVPVDVPFPESQSTNFHLYKTFDEVEGLDHLEGKVVSVLVNGFVEGSPLNVNDIYEDYVVDDGKITLANDLRGAIIHVGLPYNTDAETLDVHTVEQKPTTFESILCNKVDLAFYESRGIYIGDRFGPDGTNEGMVDPEEQQQYLSEGSIGGAIQEPYTRDVEVIMDGSWETKGHICLRGVDPLPWELLDVTPDLEILWRK